jgi:hypothetical protein
MATGALAVLLALAGAMGDAAAADAPANLLGPYMPYTAFDRMPATTVRASGAQFRIAYGEGELAVSRADFETWLRNSALAIAGYFGRFPVTKVRILVVPVHGSGIHGTSWGHRGAAIRITLGRDVQAADLINNWVMVHEMVHLGLPALPDQQNWLDEGLATYVESVARAQAGLVTAEDTWRGFVKGMPKGQPHEGDAGLDHTPTWGRTYWGGALFCLLADVEMRKRTGNRSGLRDALQGVVSKGGNREQEWPLDRFIATADRAAGVDVLRELYERMKATPVEVDLDTLWGQLGVMVEGTRVRLDGDAPLAAIRRAILER